MLKCHVSSDGEKAQWKESILFFQSTTVQFLVPKSYGSQRPLTPVLIPVASGDNDNYMNMSTHIYVIKEY